MAHELVTKTGLIIKNLTSGSALTSVLVNDTNGLVQTRTDSIWLGGTASQYHIAVFDNSSEISGSANFTWNGTTLYVNGNINPTGDFYFDDVSTQHVNAIVTDIDSGALNTELPTALAVWNLVQSAISVEDLWDRNAGSGYVYPATAGDDIYLPVNDSMYFGGLTGNRGRIYYDGDLSTLHINATENINIEGGSATSDIVFSINDVIEVVFNSDGLGLNNHASVMVDTIVTDIDSGALNTELPTALAVWNLIQSTTGDTTYDIKAVTTTGGSFLRLTGSNAITDDVKFASGTAVTVSYTDDNTITIDHTDTSTQTSVNNSNGNVIQDVTLDTFGHVTGLTSTNLDTRYLIFKTINISSDSGFTWGSSDVVADLYNDTLKLVAGANITIETDASGDAIKISGASLTGYVTGTGVDNQLAIWSGTNTLDGSSKLTYDGTIFTTVALAKLNSSTNTGLTSTTNLISFATTRGTGANVSYTITDDAGTNMRMGTILIIWNTTAAEYTEYSTKDVGDTTDVVMSADVNSTNVRVIATISSGTWNIKTAVNII